MIKKDLLSNLKSFIIFMSVLIGMFLLVYLIYPFIITDEVMASMEEMMKMFPEEMLKAFNMDLSSIDTAYGWLKSEGFTYVLLIAGIYASILGANILLKEEYEKTIEYLSYLPIKRSKIVTNKIITSLIYIVSMVVIFTIFNYIGLTLSGDFNQKEFFLLSVSPLFVAIPLFFLNLFISTLAQRNKRIIGFSLGLVFIFYLLGVFSGISENAEPLKYFTLYTYSFLYYKMYLL